MPRHVLLVPASPPSLASAAPLARSLAELLGPGTPALREAFPWRAFVLRGPVCSGGRGCHVTRREWTPGPAVTTSNQVKIVGYALIYFMLCSVLDYILATVLCEFILLYG